MVRIRKPVLAVLAGLSIVVGGCSSSGAATPSPATSATVAPAVAVPTVAPATPTPPAPDDLFTRGIAEGPAWKSFHLKIALGGTIKASFLQATGSPTFKKLTSDVSLDGIAIEGDVDAVNLAFHMPIDIPAMPAIGVAATSGDLIIKDSMLYLKLPALGAKYREVKLGTMTKELLDVPVAIPTAGGSSLVGIADIVANVRQQLEANGVTPQLAGTDQIGGRAAYHINLVVPVAQLNSDLAAAEAAAKSDRTTTISPSLLTTQIDTATAGVWIYTDNYELAQVQIAVASSTVGSLTFTMTLSNFDQPVTINAPAASDVNAGL